MMYFSIMLAKAESWSLMNKFITIIAWIVTVLFGLSTVIIVIGCGINIEPIIDTGMLLFIGALALLTVGGIIIGTVYITIELAQSLYAWIRSLDGTACLMSALRYCQCFALASVACILAGIAPVCLWHNTILFDSGLQGLIVSATIAICLCFLLPVCAPLTQRQSLLQDAEQQAVQATTALVALQHATYLWKTQAMDHVCEEKCVWCALRGIEQEDYCTCEIDPERFCTYCY